MPVTWKIDAGVVVVNLIGDYERRDIEAALEAAMKDPAFRPGAALLVDVRSSLSYISEDEGHRRARLIASFAARGLGPRIALVTAPSASRVGTAMRAAAVLREGGQDAQCFVDRAEAEQWLRQNVSAASRRTPSS